VNGEFLGESLIFILSQPRAGSTLLQRILAGHPLVHSSAEPWLMLHPVYALRDTGLQAEYDSRLAHTALQDFLLHYADGEVTYIRAIRAWADVLYGGALRRTEKKFFLDKTPRYYFIIPELRRIFPKARFIFLVRNPLAVLSSIISIWIKDNWLALAAVRQDLLLAPHRILEGIDLLGREAIIIRYEELVTVPEESVSSLCQRLKISFSKDMLHYGAKQPPEGRMGDSIGIHKHKMPTADSLDKWLHLADREQTRHFALAYLDELGPDVIQRLGYSFQELKDAMERPETRSSTPLVPWHIAIRPGETWTRKERLLVERAMAVQREGVIRGTMSFVRKNYRPLVRSLLPV